MLKSTLLLFLLISHLALAADEDEDEDFDKHSLRCNMARILGETPPDVTSVLEMFSEGIFYGRLRSNSFAYAWDKELTSDTGVDIRKNHAIIGIGGNLMYKSAYLHGFAITAALHATKGLGTLSAKQAYLYRSSRNAFNRHDRLSTGATGFFSFAEAYVEYKYNESSLKVGRQIFETFLTRANDTKMIPNTFQGATLSNLSFLDSTFKIAYLTKQKLRDHSDFHHILAFGDDSSDPYRRFSQNDDSGMHRGLTVSALRERGIKDRLIILEGVNVSLKDFTFKANYTAAPDLIASAMMQVSYRMEIEDFMLIPTLRYMHQFDNGAGAIAGANILTLTSGYTNPDSLDSALVAARVDIVHDAFKLRLGYSAVADKGDIVAPWRGFPTGGFTRGLSQSNWMANTKSYMAQFDYELESIPGLKMRSRFIIQDFDDDKIGVRADSNVFTLDLFKKVFNDKIYLRTRYIRLLSDDDTITRYDQVKPNLSYNEIRFEINYLF